MDTLALSVSSAVHCAENFSLPLIRSRSVVTAVALGIPVAVLLHDTAHYWLPASFELPIISWFRRKWRKNPEEKVAYLLLARNAIIFFYLAMVLGEGVPYHTPMDYVSDRVSCSTARKTLNERIQKGRHSAFSAAEEVVGEEGLNDASARQQRDTALRRRFFHETRATN
uniref:Uncharacterized protein TCIL3000_9_4130 n=1 Tax=Trypanosoma congolense (strain IL3000) TaxID=1068625 RepID=G0UUE9_TRYCI|nr:unnamed protein product [Trypanosoma congolense IL3000]